MKIFTYSGVILLIIIGIGFAILNAEQVNIDLFFISKNMPVSLLVVATLIIGGLLGIMASLPLLFRIKRENRKLRRKINLTEKEIANLRTLPLQDNH